MLTGSPHPHQEVKICSNYPIGQLSNFLLPPYPGRAKHYRRILTQLAGYPCRPPTHPTFSCHTLQSRKPNLTPLAESQISIANRLLVHVCSSSSSRIEWLSSIMIKLRLLPSFFNDHVQICVAVRNIHKWHERPYLEHSLLIYFSKESE